MLFSMIALKAHFDGKVFVPDEPLVMKPYQKVRLTVETDDTAVPVHPPARPQTDWHSLIGITNRDGTQPPHDPADEDALWEKGPLPKLH